MIVYHATKKWEDKNKIIKDRLIRACGSSLTEKGAPGPAEFAHVSLTPFVQGSYALDVVGVYTLSDRAWIFKVEIDNCISLAEDPSGDDKHYKAVWRVSSRDIPIRRFLKLTYIPSVLAWEEGTSNGRKLKTPTN